MIASDEKAPPRGATGTGQMETKCWKSSIHAATPQGRIHGGMYARRAEWIFDGLADLEHSAVSCLLRAPAGGEAQAILDQLPPLTIQPLRELVEAVRADRAKRLFRDWPATAAAFADEWHEHLRVYSMGPKCRFTEFERAAHVALVELLTAEGGRTSTP
jgi:hypothetical protein